VTLPGETSSPAGRSLVAPTAPGPVNRSSFFAQQERNRRATWRLSVLCVFTVLCTGMVLSLILAPPIYGLVILGLSLAQKHGSLPPEVWRSFQHYAQSFIAILDHFSNHPKPLPPTDTVVYTLTAFLLPGMIVQFVLWLGIRAMYMHAGAGGVLLTLGARPPRLEDLAERKLVDVVAEMSIAGGVPSPKVMLLESDASNAAVVGSSRQDATLVVSRGLMDDLNRDQLQAVVGHLIASAGNGDLRIAMTMVSVYQALGLLDTLINAPFGQRARRALGRFLLMAFRRNAADADEVSEWLTSGLRSSDSDDSTNRLTRNEEKPGCLSTLLLPFIWFNFSLRITTWVLSSLFFEPAAAYLWRARRHLADATAVQLTRNPDALASALQYMSDCGGWIPGGKWASHLFILDQRAQRIPPQLARRIQEMRQAGLRVTREERLKFVGEMLTQANTSVRIRRAAREESIESTTGGMVSLHPPLEKRLERLRLQGAHFAAGGKRKTPLFVWLIAVFVVGPLLLLMLLMLLTVVAMCIMLNFLFITIAFAVILLIVRLLPL
jgi:Zn-dependent protease with chaperone function